MIREKHAGSVKPKVVAVVSKDAYGELKKEVPDLFNNPEVKVELVEQDVLEKIIKEKS